MVQTKSFLQSETKIKIVKLFLFSLFLFINTNTVFGQVMLFKSNEFITDWQVCGPFPYEDNNDINTDFLIEHGGESAKFPSYANSYSSPSFPGGKVTWKNAKADKNGKLDFIKYLTPNQQNNVYASAVIKCEKETHALLKTGSNDRLKVWLNGDEIFYYPEVRASGPDEDYIKVILKKGNNHLLCKVDQAGGSWWLYARFEELISIDDQIFVSKPIISAVSKATSKKNASDIFSVLAYNGSTKPVGPVSITVLQNSNRKSSTSTSDKIEAGGMKWLIVESETDLTKVGDELKADLKITSGKKEKIVQIRAERAVPPSSPDLKIYVVPHSHADLSWPDSPEICTNLNCQAIYESIDILGNLPEFKFSEEDIFVLQEFLRRNPNRTEEVRDLLDRKIIECGAFYFGPSESLLGGEGLIRNLYFGKLWLKNKFGIETDMAWNVDVVGHTMQMPQILSKAGINNFVIWKVLMRNENNLNVTGYVGPNNFRWQSPDGSKIMVAYCPQDYGAGRVLRTDHFFSASKNFQKYITQEIAHNFQWNLPPVIMMADGSDCAIPDSRVGTNAKRWNEIYSYPTVKIASTSEFFNALNIAESKNEGTIHTFEGELPDWWSGTQSVENDAFMLSRHAENFVSTAEKFSVINDLLFPDYEYPKFSIDNVWKNKLWVHEHNWGGNNGEISDAIKLDKAREAYRLSDDLKSNTLGVLVNNIKCKESGIPLIVFNNLSWSRKDIVDHIVSVEEKGITELHLVDGIEKEVPSQINVLATHSDGSISRAEVIFEADIPSLGYATYYLTAGKNQTKTKLIADDSVLENKFFKINIDPKTGGINSIIDKKNNREILDTSKYQGNELIALENIGVDEAEEFTENWWRMNEKPATVVLKESGPIRATVEIKGSLLNSKRTQEITMYASIPRIDLKTTLDWDGQKEIQVNTTFPFKIDNPKLTYEVPFGTVEYGKENPASKACHATVRATNNWINLSNNNMGITLATDVTPFDLKDRNDIRFHDARIIKGENEANKFSMFFGGDYNNFSRIAMDDPLLLKTDFVVQPILLRSVFSCGDKDLYFTQEGEHKYRFAIRTHDGAMVSHKEVRFGQEHNSPLVVLKGKSSEGRLPDNQSFLKVSKPNIIVTVLKKAEDGSGMILRCYETDGLESDVTISLFKKIIAAEHTNIIEQEGKEIKPENGQLKSRIGAYAIETFKLKFE